MLQSAQITNFMTFIFLLRPHPHKVVGRENCKNGLYKIVCDVSSLVQLTNLGIQCVTRRKMEESLKIRELLKIDPFNSKLNHKISNIVQ